MRHAGGRARPVGSVLQQRAGVQLLAAGEDQRLAATDGRAGVRRLDPAGWPAAVRAGLHGSFEVGVAGVGQQQLGRMLGQRPLQGSPHDRVGGVFGGGHLQGAMQAGVEVLPLALGLQLRLAGGGGPTLGLHHAAQWLHHQHPQHAAADAGQQQRDRKQLLQPVKVLEQCLKRRFDQQIGADDDRDHLAHQRQPGQAGCWSVARLLHALEDRHPPL